MTASAMIRTPTPLSWETLQAISGEQGTPFYIADTARFEANYRRLLHAFRAIYANTQIGYSYKTNYLPAFVLRAHSLGAYSEVVSQFELKLARSLGVQPERTIFNGPIKRRPALLGALNAGVIVNVDSTHEARSLVAAGDALPSVTPLGIRCWLGPDTPNSRFGIDLASARGRALLAEINAAPHLYVAGLHCHYSGKRSVEQYQRITRALIDIHADVLGKRPLDYIDVGGGFASNMSPPLAAQLPGVPGTFKEYAVAIATEMRDAYGVGGPELILEPGMSLLADTMMLVTRVEVAKHLGSRSLAVVDGSIFNIKPLRGGVNLPITVVSPRHRSPPVSEREAGTVWDVVGNTCMEIDVMHEGYRGAIDVGDYIVIENVGAYTNVLNAPFIHGTPAIVELSSDGATAILRPRSTTADLLHSYGYRTDPTYV